MMASAITSSGVSAVKKPTGTRLLLFLRSGPLIDPTVEWVPPGLPPSLTRPNGQPAPEDDGPLDYVERL
jgi:hypothetical protein